MIEELNRLAVDLKHRLGLHDSYNTQPSRQKGSPYLNAVEECWHRAKQALLVSKYYKTKHDMQHSISEYLEQSDILWISRSILPENLSMS